MNDGTTYVCDGYEDGAMRIIEKRGGKPVHVWRGYFNGGNHMNMKPAHPWNGVWDGRERRPMILSVFEIARAD